MTIIVRDIIELGVDISRLLGRKPVYDGLLLSHLEGERVRRVGERVAAGSGVRGHYLAAVARPRAGRARTARKPSQRRTACTVGVLARRRALESSENQ